MNDQTIFILEDHDLMRRMLRRLLEEDGLTVLGEATSAEDALYAPELRRAALVLVDLSLPGMSGLDFIRSPRTEANRCLVVSAHTEPFYIQAARQAGAAGFVAKDDPDAILAAVRRALEAAPRSSANGSHGVHRST